MADKDIQIRIENGAGGWDSVFPKTKSHLVEGLDGALNDKVDKVSGKGLSSEDYTTAEKNKLSGIQAGAQVNSVTSVAGKTGAVTLVKGDVGLDDLENYPIATQGEAETGEATNRYMTPQRVAQAIQAQTGDLGGGDMTKAVYDTNDNGKVDVAEVAESVTWGNVTGKPSDFIPSPHVHNADDITSGVLNANRIPDATTAAAGKVQLNNTTSSSSTSLAATANAVKNAYDLASSKTKIHVGDTEPSNADIWFEELT